MATTPNMGLTLPVVGTTLGPAWAYQLNTALEAIDLHDHTTSKGKKITPAAININSDISFNGFQANDVGLLEVTQAANTVAVYGSVQNINGELNWVDGNGFVVPITSGGSVVGPAGQISGLVAPASAVYSSSTFSWYSSAGILAQSRVGAVVLHQGGQSANPAITISAPASGVSAYAFSVPAALIQSGWGVWYVNNIGESYFYPIFGFGVQTGGEGQPGLGLNAKSITGGAQGVNGKIADQTITNGDISPTADINASKLLNLSINTGKIADGAVTGGIAGTTPTGKIAYRTIVTENIAELAISTAKIAALAVTGGGVSGKIAAQTITDYNIAAGAAIQSTKISFGASTVPGSALQDSSVALSKIQQVNAGIDLADQTSAFNQDAYYEMGNVAVSLAVGNFTIGIRPRQGSSGWISGMGKVNNVLVYLKLQVVGPQTKYYEFRWALPDFSFNQYISVQLPVSCDYISSGGSYTASAWVKVQGGGTSDAELFWQNLRLFVQQG